MVHFRDTFLIFVKNIFYKHVIIFLVEYFFASVKLFQKNLTPLICRLYAGTCNNGNARSTAVTLKADCLIKYELFINGNNLNLLF